MIILNSIAIGLSYEDTAAVMSGEVLDPVTPAVVDAFGSWAEKPFELVVLAAFVACGIAVQATATRVLFSLSRDRMLPISGVLSRVGGRQVPLGALAVASVVSACGLLFGLNARAVNTLITFGSGGYYITFWLVCAAALYARLSGRWVPAGRFSLGRFALPGQHRRGRVADVRGDQHRVATHRPGRAGREVLPSVGDHPDLRRPLGHRADLRAHHAPAGPDPGEHRDGRSQRGA